MSKAISHVLRHKAAEQEKLPSRVEILENAHAAMQRQISELECEVTALKGKKNPINLADEKPIENEGWYYKQLRDRRA